MKRHFPFQSLSLYKYAILLALSIILLQNMEVGLSAQEEIIIETIQIPNHQPQIRRYRKGKLLGRGGFANCYLGTDIETNTQVAIKVIEKRNLLRNRSKQKLLSEIKIHKMLKHPHVVKFLTVFEDIKRVFIIVELCENNALSDFVRRRKRLSSIEVKRFMLQLLQAIAYLHSLKIIHRDLKMANIFLDSTMSIKVGDLGLATKLQFQDERKRTMCGTPNYIAPEIISGGLGHSYEVDIWSAGVICYAMMYGRPPFQASETAKTYEKIKHGLFDFPNIEGLTSQFKDFISKILIVDPKRRMTIEEMKKHPFLNITLPPITYNKLTMTPIYDSVPSLPYKTILPPEENVFSCSKDRNTKEKNSTDLTLKPNGKKEGSDGIGIQNEWNHESVLCYVDYSTKYGLGYTLSNGNYGVYFNDSSLLYTSIKSHQYFYSQNPSSPDQQFSKFTQQEIEKAPALQKKYILMRKFIIYLDDQLKQPGCQPSDDISSSPVYLKQWLKTKHAIMFRLNNKIFQVDFFDGSRVSLQTESKRLLIKNKKGEIKYAFLQEALEEKEGELSRRIKYIRQILNKIKQK